MKRHEFFFEFFPNNCLFGLSISQYESQIEDIKHENNWHPTLRFAVGFIFFTISYTRISIY